MPETGQPIRIVYFGTPAYAVPALRSLAGDPRFEITLVVTQPDRPAGRGRALQSPAIKLAAESLGLPVYQPESLRPADARRPLEMADADLFVVAAYGLIFGQKTLSIPRFGCLNLHASLLPKYRGASPITAAILSGDEVTGVTLMRMDAGMDTGDIISARSLPILAEDITGTLTERLALLGAELSVDELPRWIAGEVLAKPQPTPDASLVRPLVKADGWIVWSKPALEIERQIRAMQPWPRAWTTLPNGSALQIVQSSVTHDANLPPGHVHLVGKEVVVSTGDGALHLHRVQPAGSSEMTAHAAVLGRRLVDGDLLGAIGAPEVPPPLVQPVCD